MRDLLIGFFLGILISWWLYSDFQPVFSPGFSVLGEVAKAERWVWVEAYYLDYSGLRILCELAERGVRVKVLLNSREREDGLRLQECGAEVRLYPGFLHSKMAIIDGKRVYVGSHNFASSSFSNREVGVILYGKVEEFQRAFQEAWESGSPP